MVDIALLGANGQRLDLAGRNAGRQGVILAAGQVKGIYGAPIQGDWRRAARQRGGTFKGRNHAWRDLALGMHLFGDDNPNGIEWLDSLIDQMIPDDIDEWDPNEPLARLVIRSKKDTRKLSFIRYDDTDFEPEFDPTHEDEQYENPIYKVRAGMPFWEGKADVTHFRGNATSESGHIEVWNPTPVVMCQAWVLTRAQWTIPDPSWIGPKGKRVPGGEFASRAIPLLPIDSVHAGARINYDPMRLMLESWSGTNLLGSNGGQSFFMHKIPPYTPRTWLPISYTGAPPGGARAELRQPRLWPKPWGGELI